MNRKIKKQRLNLRAMLRRMSLLVGITTGAAGMMLSSTLAYAQVAGTGTIQGTIRDSQGSVVSGAQVTATNPATGRSETQTTSSTGTYVLAALPPGTYTVKVSAQGFKALTQQNIVVNAVSVVGFDVTLQLGAVQENIVVTAAPPDLQTENGSLGTTIPNDTYTSLPLALSGSPKSPLGFVYLVPGVAGGDFGVPAINGGPSNSSFLYLNGLPVTTSEMQGDARNINGSTSTEVVDSFQVISSGVPAYYAGQGITNFVSKSGTNQIHGSVYENIRNTVFDAGGFFPLPGSPIPPEHQNEYGGSIGGHILKDRLFYFGNVDRYRYTSLNNPVLYSLPTDAERNGDFSALDVPIYDPKTTVCNNGICTRQPFAGNIIPADRISSISQQLQSYLPATMNDGLQNNYQNSYLGGVYQNMYLGKVDVTINQHQHAFALGQYGINSTLGIPNNGGAQLPEPYGSTRTSQQIIWLGQVGHTWMITPHVINVFGAQFNRFDTPFLDPTNGGGYPGKAGLTGLPSGPPSDNFPSIAFGGANAPTNWHDTFHSQNVVEIANTYVYQDNVTIQHGRHNITFGGQIIAQQENTSVPSALGAFNFSNNETAGFDEKGNLLPSTGNGYASYLLGEVDSASATDTAITTSGARYKNYAIYAQDDWKATSKLALNLGLRYLIPIPYTEVLNRYSFLNPTTPNPAVDGYPGALEFAGHGTASCNCSTNVQTHYMTFDPRIGLAYAFTRQTVLRASFGINHFNGGALGGNASSQGPSQLGYSASPSFSSPDSGITPAFNWATGFPEYQHPPFYDPTLNTGYNTTVGANAGGVAYNRPDSAGKSPYTENWNITVSQAFGDSLTAELSYAGSESHFIGINGGEGIYSDQILPKYESLGSLLQQPLTPEVLAQAQAQFPEIQVPYSNFQGSLGQALRPFPQYSGVGDSYADFGNASYHSLQAKLQKRMSKGLYFLASYTWSKNMNDGSGVINFIYTSARSAYDIHREWAAVGSPHVFSLSFNYKLPFGRGYNIGSGHLADAFIGGWGFSGILSYSAGGPLGPIGASCLVLYSGSCWADYGTERSPRLDLDYGSGMVGNRNTVYLNANAFATPAQYTWGNTPRTAPLGLHGPGSANEDFSLGKNFHLFDRVTFRFQADAFNAFNRVVFSGPNTSLASSAFGQISSQANSPRRLQFEGSIHF